MNLIVTYTVKKKIRLSNELLLNLNVCDNSLNISNAYVSTRVEIINKKKLQILRSLYFICVVVVVYSSLVFFLYIGTEKNVNEIKNRVVIFNSRWKQR